MHTNLSQSYVHGNEGHEIWRKWVGLYNADEGSDLQGYLRCSVVVLKPGDVPAFHEDDEDDEEVEGDDLSKMVLLPPQIEQIGYELHVRCYRAEKLPKMDTCLLLLRGRCGYFGGFQWDWIIFFYYF